MSLASVATVQAYTDKMAAAWNLALSDIGTKTGSAVTGTVRGAVNNLLTAVLATLDYQQITDLAADVNTALGKATSQAMFSWLSNLNSSLQAHIQSRGSLVATSITDLASFLAYYNGGLGGAAFSSTLVPEIQAIWLLTAGNTALPNTGVMSPALQPDYNATYTNGMGQRAVGGSFTAGASVDTTQYCEVNLVAEVIVNYSGGTGAPTITVAGTDDQGGTGTTWSGTFSGNNPTAALSGVTITPSITAMQKSSVVVSSSTGIVPGSVLIINKNKPDQEVVIVEAVADGTHITAGFRKAHSAGATIDGWTSIQLTPSPSGRRCRSVSNITLGITGHAAGTVRLNGVQDRVGMG